MFEGKAKEPESNAGMCNFYYTYGYAFGAFLCRKIIWERLWLKKNAELEDIPALMLELFVG